MYPKTSIVIVGGGFGGVACARECARLFRHRPDVAITLISPRPYHDFHPALYEVATAAAGTQVCLRKAVCLPLSEIFAYTKVKLVHGIVRAVNRKERFVSLTHSEHIFYTYLVLALGSTTEYYQIPGLREHALVLKDVESALRIRREVMKYLQRKDQDGIQIVVGGGGFTGTELAAELVGCLRRLSIKLQDSGFRFQATLIEGSTALVSQLGDKVSRMARERLKKLGVCLVEKNRIVRIEAQREEGGGRKDGVVIHLMNGEPIVADILMWTGGVRGSHLYEHIFPYSIGHQGRVTVEATLQVAGEENIFAAGDGACLANGAYPQGLPMQAQVAIAQGREAAKNLARHLQGIPLKAFQTPVVSYIIPLGGRYAAAKLRERWMLRGFVPWVLKQLIELHYYCSLLGLGRGLRAWVGMEKICMRND